jgi:hypothetical protein
MPFTVLLTDERLEYLANRFLDLRVREYTGATFEEYIGNSELLDFLVQKLRNGKAMVWRERSGTVGVVQLCSSGGLVVAEVSLSLQ